MKSLKALFHIRETYIGIAAAIAFQVIFFSVWMTAYDGVNDRMDQLKIGLVNEDEQLGIEITNQLENQLPFQIQSYTSIENAKSIMDERQIDMIIQIPSSVTTSLASGEQAQIVYWINQSNATLVKTMMENTAVQLTNQMNQQFYPVQINEARSQFIQQLPLSEESALIVEDAVLFLLDSLDSHPLSSSIKKTNEVDGFAANFVPLMIILSSFVGAMVMIMQLELATQSIQETISKWNIFIGRQIIQVGVALLLPLLTIGLMTAFHITSQLSIPTLYLFQFILFWAFLSFAQVFVVLFGNAGMVFNILALSLQLVTSGVLVPRAVLSDWYMKVGSILPATYGADGYYTIIFGGSDTNIYENMSSLFVIIIVTLLLSIGAVFLKKQTSLNNNM
ncbi:YhgE/Pip domain-containing protein [Solibacillus sp. FSL K6-1523]|uniref:YhgE/Pip domain-containing protein n=1 Tax=Solibacillus sp. FSL K6-1523 TaxID=2921471 RepID=UPI0030FBEBD7